MNTGFCNTGDYNTGFYNTGNYNTGFCNAGNYNTGFCNTGNYNTGNYNTGNYNTGFCNSITPDTCLIFNRPARREDWYNAKIPDWMSVRLTVWIDEIEMTDKEKQAYPSYITNGGYLKCYSNLTAAYVDAWEKASEEDRKLTEQLPNFDPCVFAEVFGFNPFNNLKEENNMNMDDLTLGQIKQLQSILNVGAPAHRSIYDRYIGKYVICRSYNEGINAGKVLMADETGVVLEDARRLWYHKPAKSSVLWYEGVAKEGLSDDSKVSEPREKLIVENYSLTICDEKAEKSIREAASHGQS